MDSVVSKLQETGQHVAKAGKTFLDEVRDAGRGLAVLVRTAFTPSALERELLSRVDGTLRTLDSKVRERIASLEKRATTSAARKTNGKRRARRAGAVASRSTGTTGSLSASARH